jgi:NNP family nitrate/nitrite transporter-like MFS transporter
VLVLGVLLGFAGAAFAVALPLASRWYPPQHQGTALGIAGAGNSGTVLAALFAPGLAAAYGWGNVFGMALIPVGAAFLVYSFAKDAPTARRPSRCTSTNVLKDRDAWWFMFFYFCTFGGFVGLASSLTLYFNDQYGMTPIEAGYFTAACVFAGSLVRPIGGALADRIGGIDPAVMYVLARSSSPSSVRAASPWVASPGSCWRWPAWALATAQYSSWCRSASARKSA